MQERSVAQQLQGIRDRLTGLDQSLQAWEAAVQLAAPQSVWENLRCSLEELAVVEANLCQQHVTPHTEQSIAPVASMAPRQTLETRSTPNPSGSHWVNNRDYQQLEVALQASENLLNSVLNGAAVAIVRFLMFDDRSYQYEYCSKGCEVIYGYTAEELIADPGLWASHVFSEDLENIIFPTVDQILAGQNLTVEYRFYHKNGSLRWLSDTLTSYWDEARCCWRVTAVASDITDRKQAEFEKTQLIYQLEAERAQLEAIIQSMPDAVYIGDAAGIWKCNQQALQQLGFNSVEELKQNISLLAQSLQTCYVDTRERLPVEDEVFYHALQGKSVVQEVLFCHLQSGEERIVRSAAAPIWLQGEIIGAVAVNTDITERKRAEAALQQQSELLQTIVDHVPAMLTLSNADGSLKWVNREWENTLGWTLEKAQQRDILVTLYPDPEEYQRARDFIQAAERVWEDFKVMTREGLSLDISWANVKLSNGCNIGIGRNISACKQAEAALRQSEARFRAIFEHSGIGIAVTTAPDFKLTQTNAALHRMLGYSQEELAEMDHLQVTHPEDWNLTDPLKPQEVATGCWESYTVEKRYLHKEGRMIWGNLIVSLLRGADGQVQIGIGMVEDITQRKQAEVALRESEERFREIAETIDEVFFVESAECRQTLYVSPAYERIWGRDTRSLYENSQSWLEAVHPDDRSAVLAYLDSLQLGDLYEREYRIVQPDGTVRWISSRSFPVRNEAGELLRHIGLASDITERKQIEEQLKASLCEKDVLLKEIHHRVKNNLQIVSSLLYLQADHVNEPRLHQILQSSQDRVICMALVHESLYRSQNLSQVNFSEYTETLVTNLFRSYNIHSQSILLRINISTDLIFNLDQALNYGLIINELMSNALKHGFRESRSGEVWIELSKVSNHELLLEIGNTGDRFPTELNLQKLQSVGLNLVMSLIKQLKGSLELVREPATVFRIKFPTQV